MYYGSLRILEILSAILCRLPVVGNPDPQKNTWNDPRRGGISFLIKTLEIMIAIKLLILINLVNEIQPKAVPLILCRVNGR